MDYLLTLLTDPNAWAALAALAAMEVVLGIDNLVFISIISNKLPEAQRSRARKIGIAGALILRLVLLTTVAMIIRLTYPVFEVFGNEFSWRDIILLAGGLFLVWKATKEIHHNVDFDDDDEAIGSAGTATAAVVIGQILLLDLVFSVDSIITAVGMTEHLPIMIAAVLIAVGTMLFAADPLGNFISRNPSVVMLALGFLLLIGTTLIAEGFGVYFPKGYVYAAMAFSVFVEGLNIMSRRARRRRARQQAGQ